MKKIIACAAVLAAMVGSASAQVQVRPLVGLGITYGGDTIAKVTYTNGDTATVHAGSLLDFIGGVHVQFTPLVSGQVILGYQFDRANASNGSVTFDRVPLEFLGHFAVSDSFRLGGGARYVSGAKTRARGAASGPVGDEDFKQSWGAVFEGEYMATRYLGIKARYVAERFQSKTFPGSSDVDGSHVGIFAVYYFN